MNFDYSDDQIFLKEEARKFLAAHCTSAVTRSVLDDPAKPFDPELWRAVADMGWTGATIPERWGGSGLGPIELCAIAEELGRVIAPIPFASTVYIFADAVLVFGSDDQRNTLLPGVAKGEVIGCLATSEGSGHNALNAMAARVTDGRLHGVKVPVTDGDIATHAIVAAQGEDGNGAGLFMVDLSEPGVAREALPSLDPTRSVARLTFDGAPCTPLGDGQRGEDRLAVILDRAAVYFAFEQVGGADRCLDAARAYALERHAFGRIIASYQAIKHKLADVYVRNELARSSAYYGAWAISTDASELPEAAAAARIAAIQAYDFASKENLQTHGGMGFTWEVDCHLHLRRARQLALALGGLPVWRERLVSRLESRTAF